MFLHLESYWGYFTRFQVCVHYTNWSVVPHKQTHISSNSNLKRYLKHLLRNHLKLLLSCVYTEHTSFINICMWACIKLCACVCTSICDKLQHSSFQLKFTRSLDQLLIKLLFEAAFRLNLYIHRSVYHVPPNNNMFCSLCCQIEDSNIKCCHYRLVSAPKVLLTVYHTEITIYICLSFGISLVDGYTMFKCKRII